MNKLYISRKYVGRFIYSDFEITSNNTTVTALLQNFLEVPINKVTNKFEMFNWMEANGITSQYKIFWQDTDRWSIQGSTPLDDNFPEEIKEWWLTIVGNSLIEMTSFDILDTFF